MSEENKYTEGVFSKGVIEFITVSSEVCLFLEKNYEFSKIEFLEQSQKLLPLLYLKTSMLHQPERLLEEDPERFVNETEYESIKNSISDLLGASDRYLEVFHPDIQLSEEGIASDISENLADIYQDLKDFLLCYQIGNEDIMNDALATCLQSFKEYWGQRLVNCLRAIHYAIYNFTEEDDNDNTDTNSDITKKSILSHQQSEELDDFLNSLNTNDEI